MAGDLFAAQQLGFCLCGTSASLAPRTMELPCQLSHGGESHPTIIIRLLLPHPTSHPRRILAHTQNSAVLFENVD